MAHFGLIGPPGTSHVTALTTIGRELCRRGHVATVFNVLDVEELALKEGMQFRAIGRERFPKGSLAVFADEFGKLRGLSALVRGIQITRDDATVQLQETADAMRSAGVTALLVDQGQFAGSTIAEHLSLPFVTVCNAAPGDRDLICPPPFTPWQPATTSLERLRNRAMYRVVDLAMFPVTRRINSYRKVWGLKPLRSIYDTMSTLLELAQETEDFDFPRHQRPPEFHYIGIIRRTESSAVTFPFERLDGRPIVYVSVGTVATANRHLFRVVCEACVGLNVQLIITLGNNGEPGEYADLPSSPIIVPYAPQLEIIGRSALTICHGGHNTVLDSLAAGVPVVVIPLATDNFGVAARVRYSGAGDFMLLNELSVSRVRELVEKILAGSVHRERALALSQSFAKAGGERRAADLIEQKLSAR